MVYSDNSKEIKKVVRQLGFPHRTSVPGIPATNSLAEGRVRIVVSSTNTALENAGLPCAFWPYAARHACVGLNTRMVNGTSSYFRRCGEHFAAPAIPFGCRVFFKPSPISAQQPLKFEGDTMPGLFMGYVLDPGGKWSGEYYVVSLAAFAGKPLHRRTPANELRVHVQRIRELLPVTQNDVFFPLREAYNKANYTLEGIEEHLKVGRGEYTHALPPDNQPRVGIEGVADSYQDDQVFVMDVANDEDGSRDLTTAPQPPAKPKQPTIPPLVSGAHGSANQPQSNNVPLTTTTNNNNQQLTGGAHGSASQLVHDAADGSSSRPPYTQADKKQVLLQDPTPSSSGSGSVAHSDATIPGGTTKVNMDDPRIPWRPHHRDKTGHWVDNYGNRMDKRSWRVPYIPSRKFYRTHFRTRDKNWESKANPK